MGNNEWERSHNGRLDPTWVFSCVERAMVSVHFWPPPVTWLMTRVNAFTSHLVALVACLFSCIQTFCFSFYSQTSLQGSLCAFYERQEREWGETEWMIDTSKGKGCILNSSVYTFVSTWSELTTHEWRWWSASVLLVREMKMHQVKWSAHSLMPDIRCVREREQE